MIRVLEVAGHIKDQNLTHLMLEHLKKRDPQPTSLSLVGQPNKGDFDTKWAIWINENVEPDI